MEVLSVVLAVTGTNKYSARAVKIELTAAGHVNFGAAAARPVNFGVAAARPVTFGLSTARGVTFRLPPFRRLVVILEALATAQSAQTPASQYQPRMEVQDASITTHVRTSEGGSFMQIAFPPLHVFFMTQLYCSFAFISHQWVTVLKS
jgi:hypothetical protein